MQKSLTYILILLLFSCFIIKAQSIERIDPPFWWADMQNKNLQLLVYGENIGNFTPTLATKDIVLTQTQHFTNNNYLALDLDITNAKTGNFDIIFEDTANNQFHYTYTLRKATPENQVPRGISQDDFMYLIMPDRFANGNYNNDIVPQMNETTIERDNIGGRHGGDIQGVIDKLDYLQSLNVTALWLNPVVENNQPKYSYHGYAATDHYKIDARFGDLALYQQLSEELHRRHMKLVLDIIHNHIGDQHWWMKDLPDSSWVHFFDTYTNSNFRMETLLDPYATEIDKELYLNGWFDVHMPDLNQTNPFVATYLIQNNIWWIKNFQIDALRMDTWPYSEPNFLKKWAAAIRSEFPDISIFSEVWVHDISIHAFFHPHNIAAQTAHTAIDGLTDFQWYNAVIEAVNNPSTWTGGLMKLHNTLAYDYLYDDVSQNVIFLDNHDLIRLWEATGQSMYKYKIAVALLLSMRGIPCWYYGSEVLMRGTASPMDNVRTDFLGTWKNDTTDLFTSKGRNDLQNEAFFYLQKLTKLRAEYPALRKGTFKHYLPQNDVYVYARSMENQHFMMIVNTSDKMQNLHCDRFAEVLQDFSQGKDLISDKQFDFSQKTFTVAPQSAAWILLSK
ncbi:MAG: alpha-amylase family glycosyl hydrolase [Chitinophagales bacterium]|nr:cyclomaltodextrinase N-terminal domain-containing protein [Bacteroidota bacterium]MCB9042686.1 cyclomaltodextrinase N-terminal domain-containing protein [Chitinophagales bacterium]